MTRSFCYIIFLTEAEVIFWRLTDGYSDVSSHDGCIRGKLGQRNNRRETKGQYCNADRNSDDKLALSPLIVHKANEEKAGLQKRAK